MSPNGRPSLTASMTPDQLAAFEERFMREIVLLPDGRVARSCFVRLHEAEGLYARLYSVLQVKGQKEEEDSPSRFSLSVYKRQPDGTLADVTSESIQPWVSFNGSNNPELIAAPDVLRFLSDVLQKVGSASTSREQHLLPADALAIKFNAPEVDVDTLIGKEPEASVQQHGRGTIQKVILTASSLPQAKPH